MDQAWRGVDVIERFASGLGEIQKPDGSALILLSTDGEKQAMLKALRENGVGVETAAQHDFGNEVITVYRAGRTPGVEEGAALEMASAPATAGAG